LQCKITIRVQLRTGMADMIKLLPESIANQIAAGEVVQRPASIVKELLENSIDAGATQIRLIIKQSGKELIQVVDNGCGMSETDARMCFERHATSKITTSQDLFKIATMGFRGEALASIAAVAQVELRTKRASDELGTRVLVEDSTVQAHEPCQCAVGTNFTVKNLFFNVPARKNFLKNDKIELQHIVEELERVAMAYPELAFSMHQDGQEVFHFVAGNLRQRIVRILGEHINKKLIPVAEETEHVRISGFVGKPDYYKKSRGEQMFFVNKRFIKSTYMHHAVMAAYEDILPQGSYPMYALFLDLDPKHIDINVHPTKTEIKFDDERTVYNILKVAIRHGMATNLAVPSLDFDQEQAFEMNILSRSMGVVSSQSEPKEHSGEYLGKITNPVGTEHKSGSAASTGSYQSTEKSKNLPNWQQLYQGLNMYQPKDENTVPVDLSNEATHESDQDVTITVSSHANTVSGDQPLFEQSSAHTALKIPSQIHQRYIMTQLRNGVMLIDQQAASERILFEQFMKDLAQQGVATQKVLFPINIDLSPSDTIMLREILEEMNQLGFDIAHFGGDTFVIHGLPAELRGHVNEKELVERVLDQYRNNLELDLGLRENLARSLARNAALRRGQYLEVSEMVAITDKLFACAQPMVSPSGQKCYITWGFDDLQKLFAN
jgi:DNA mismatch repair protein MutL